MRASRTGGKAPVRSVLRSLSFVIALLVPTIAAPVGIAQEPPEAEPTSADHADERPPGDHPFDIYDLLSLPLRALMLPPALAGYAVREGLRLAFPAGGGSGGGAAGLSRELGEWGLEPSLPRLGYRPGPVVGFRLSRLAPLHLEAALSWRGSWRGALLLEPLAGPPAGPSSARSGWRKGRPPLRIGLAHVRQAEPHFWRPGPGAGAAEPMAYRLETAEAWATLRGTAGRLSTAVELGMEENRVGRAGDGTVPNLRDEVSPAELFGLDPGRYARAGASAELETRARQGLQHRGLRATASTTLFRGIEGTSADFLRAGIRAGAQLPVNRYQALALDIRSEGAWSLAGRGVPFTHLPSLGGGVGGRAYTGGRFRDRSLVSATAEWRYELWRTIHDDFRVEAFLFGEGGTVAPRLDALGVGDLRASWGLGLQGVDRAGIRGLGFLAVGEDGTRVGVAARWPF